jgi:hypothetical protein
MSQFFKEWRVSIFLESMGIKMRTAYLKTRDWLRDVTHKINQQLGLGTVGGRRENK